MKNLSTQETLLTVLPIVLVLLALVGAIIFFPEGSIFDIRGKAAPVRPTPTVIVVPTARPTKAPETVCSELYNPVCGANGLTYTNECEANLANALPVRQGECPATTPTRAVTPVTLPLTY